MKIKNTILITGVSSGIGFAIAEKFLNTGEWNVYGSVRKQGDAIALSYNKLFYELVFDVTDRSARQRALHTIISNAHELSVVVNNAGIARVGPLEVISGTDIRHQFEVNVFSALETVQDVLPQLHCTRQNHPKSIVRIINVTSVSSVITSPFTSLYSASKAALESLSDGLRRELLPFNIDCISVAPGPVRTAIWKKSMNISQVYKDTRYTRVLGKVERYIKNTESKGIPAEQVANTIYQAATARKPKTFQLLISKKWLVYVLSFLPSRTLDKLLWDKINQ